ncbi:MAG: hypothetical protein WC372_09295 [Candidatus Neomarinimicrobiota bacterium]|jgi:hypothetical protein
MDADWKPYLIQRMKLKKGVSENPAGIDALYSMDYTGSAEFEFGALPSSLRRITAVVDQFEVTKVVKQGMAKDGRRLYVLCHRHATEDIVARVVPHLLSGKAHLKESTNLEESLSSTKPTYSCCDAWWDVDHDWFLVLGEKSVNLLLEGLKNLRDRWAKEGKK